MGRPEVSAEQKKIKREAILKAALDVFSEKGYHAAGIADIAARLDVGHGTIYRYFKNKLDIFLTLFDALLEEFRVVSNSTNPAGANSAKEYVSEMQKFCLDFNQIFIRELNHIKIFFEEIHADPEIKKRFDLAQAEFQITSERFLTIGRDKGFVRAELHIPSQARLLNAMIFEIMKTAVLPESPSTNILLLAATLIDIFTQGVLIKPT